MGQPDQGLLRLLAYIPKLQALPHAIPIQFQKVGQAFPMFADFIPIIADRKIDPFLPQPLPGSRTPQGMGDYV